MISPQALQFAQALRARSAQQPFQGTPWADPPRPQPMQPRPAMPQQPVPGVAMPTQRPNPSGYTPMAPPQSANPRGYTPRPAQPQSMAPRAPVNPLRLM